jgi:thiol-disulfide isomerase/thioredoxin
MPALLTALVLAAALRSEKVAEAVAQPIAQPVPPVAVGDAAPRLEALTPDGAAVAEDWSKGDVVVVAFFATWCGPCHRALRELGAIRQSLGLRLRFLLVEAGDDPPAIKRFIAANPLPEGSTVITDPSGGLRRRWGCTIIPSFFIVDRTKTVRYINHGWGDSSEPHFLRRLHNVLGDTARTGPPPAGDAPQTRLR